MRSPFQRVKKNEIYLEGVKGIVVTGDVGCTGFNEGSKKVFDAILRMKTDLFFILGDMTCNGSRKEVQEMGAFAGQRTDTPIFTTCGNHDIRGYEGFYGRSCYALVLGQTVMLFLDNANRHFKEEDLLFLRNMLEKHKEKTFVVLFHVPPIFDFHRSSIPAREWDKLRAILDKHRGRIQCLIGAHLHGFYEYDLDGYHIIITAGGGASMIYEMPKGGSKIHHVLKVSMGDAGAVDVEMVPIMIHQKPEESGKGVFPETEVIEDKKRFQMFLRDGSPRENRP